MAAEIEIRDLKTLKQIARKGKEMTKQLEEFVEEIEPLLKKAYLEGSIPFEIRLRVAINFKVLKPRSK